MINRARIRNFRCLIDVDLTFEPLTILVGPNASGKSALLAAIDPRSGLVLGDAYQGSGQASVDLARDGGSLAPRASHSYVLQSLHLDVVRLRSNNAVIEAPLLSSDGSNFANVFATLTREEQNEVVKTFVGLVPMYRDVVARPSSTPGQHRLVFQDRWLASLWYEPHQVSDGSFLLLAFLTLQYQRVPVEILTIEDPERGMHPYLVGELVRMLRQLATGQLGPRSIQVVLATHSAELLEFAEPKEVRFLSRRRADGGTQIELAPLESSAEWAKAYREYQDSLGALWLSGSLGGVPGA